MNLLIYTGIAVAGMIALIIIVRVFLSPIRVIFKLLFNTALGFAGLIAINHFGSYIGVSLGVNFINAAVIGVLGLPGLALLFFIKWLCIF